jgi:N-acetylmuramoyl-L-alanine amidase
VPSGSTFYPYIRCLVCRGIVSGYPDNTFRPNNNVTRGQLAKIVSNSAGFSETGGPQIFQDVAPGSTFYDYVQRLASRGYMQGYPCGGPGEPCGPENRPYFRTFNNATRGQASKIISEAAGFSEAHTTQTFEDVSLNSTFYIWIERLASRGVMSGYPCGGPGEPCGPENRPYFRPFNNVTRGQSSKIVANTFFPDCSP